MFYALAAWCSVCLWQCEWHFTSVMCHSKELCTQCVFYDTHFSSIQMTQPVISTILQCRHFIKHPKHHSCHRFSLTLRLSFVKRSASTNPVNVSRRWPYPSGFHKKSMLCPFLCASLEIIAYTYANHRNVLFLWRFDTSPHPLILFNFVSLSVIFRPLPNIGKSKIWRAAFPLSLCVSGVSYVYV